MSTNSKTRKLKFGRQSRLAENAVNLHCAMIYKGREYLGTIAGVRYDDLLGIYRLTVRHFNGELWDFEPSALSVNILEGQ